MKEKMGKMLEEKMKQKGIEQKQKMKLLCLFCGF